MREVTIPPTTPLYEVPITIPSALPVGAASSTNTSVLAHLEIRVVDADLVPIGNRRVQVTDADGKRSNITTDRFGRALLLNLKPGRTVIDAGDDVDTLRDLMRGRNMVLITIPDPGGNLR